MIIQLQKLLLILVRITSFIFLSPGFSFKGLPNTFKVALSVAFSMVVYFTIPDIDIILNLYIFSGFIIKELLFGLALGYVSKLIFGIIEIAGQLIDFQVGFAMAAVYDPTTGAQVSNYGKVYYWISISVFFILDLHHKVIELLIKSFSYIPLIDIKYNSLAIREVINLFSKVFSLAFKLAVPMIIVVLVTDIVLGLISRSIPQINVLMLGMPMKSMIAFILTFVTITWLVNAIGENIYILPKYMEIFLKIFSGS